MKERIEDKIHFYIDGNLAEFPFNLLENEKKGYFERLSNAYDLIGDNKLLKEIKISNAMINAGGTEIKKIRVSNRDISSYCDISLFAY